MDGRRYAGGLVAGVLLGVFVVLAGSSSFISGTFGSGATLPAAQSDHQIQSTATAYFTTSTTAASVGTPSQPKDLNGSASAVSTTTRILTTGRPTTTETSTSTASNPSLTFGSSVAPAYNSGPSSSLYGIVHQPLVSNVVILVPLVLAFFVGAMIYRLSRSRDDE